MQLATFQCVSRSCLCQGGAYTGQGRPPVGGALGGVDELISQALGDGLDVPEGGLAGAGGDEVDGLVHPPQRGDIHGLAPHHTRGANAGGVLAGPAAYHARTCISAASSNEEPCNLPEKRNSTSGRILALAPGEGWVITVERRQLQEYDAMISSERPYPKAHGYRARRP